jgi:hypothetical protein
MTIKWKWICVQIPRYNNGCQQIDIVFKIQENISNMKEKNSKINDNEKSKRKNSKQ